MLCTEPILLFNTSIIVLLINVSLTWLKYICSTKQTSESVEPTVKRNIYSHLIVWRAEVVNKRQHGKMIIIILLHELCRYHKVHNWQYIAHSTEIMYTAHSTEIIVHSPVSNTIIKPSRWISFLTIKRNLATHVSWQ